MTSGKVDRALVQTGLRKRRVAQLLGMGIVLIVIAGLPLREGFAEPEMFASSPLLVETLTVTSEPFVRASCSGSVESEQHATTISSATQPQELMETQRFKAVNNTPQTDRGPLAPDLRVYLHLHHLVIGSIGETGRNYPAGETISRNLTLAIPFSNNNPLVQAG